MQQIIFKDQESQRLDLFLLKYFDDKRLSRSYWSNMIKHGYVRVADNKVKNGYKLVFHDVIRIDWPEITYKYSNEIETLFENDDVEVINKPSGILVHSKGAFNPEFTISDYIKPKYILVSGEQETDRLGIVHRLDRYTSGVMILAKNLKSLTSLQKQFSQREVVKAYIAVCEGEFKESEINIDMPISRNPKNPKCFHVDASGKSSYTQVRVIKIFDGMSLVLLIPKTGRTHQLRVHLSHINHPILGDKSYGAKSITYSGYLLHSYSLSVILPGHLKKDTYVAPIRANMASYIDDSDKEAINRQIELYRSTEINL